jgi:transposase
MNFHMPTDEEIHTAFAQGEAAVLAVFHAVATQGAALAPQLAQQGVALQAWHTRLAQNSPNSSQPPARDGSGTVKRTTRLRKAGDKPHGGQPGHEGQTLMAVEHPERAVTSAVPLCAYGHASLHEIAVMG